MSTWFNALVSVVYKRVICVFRSTNEQMHLEVYLYVRRTILCTSKWFHTLEPTDHEVLNFPALTCVNWDDKDQAYYRRLTALKISLKLPYMKLGLFGPGKSRKGEVSSP